MCSCGKAVTAGAAGGGNELWINVKGDGTPTGPMSKADAQSSRTVHGGYIRRA